MRSAPSVTYPVGRSAFLGWLLAGSGAASLAALLLGVSYQMQAMAGWWLVMGAWVLWVVIAGSAWRRQAGGQLAWKAAPRRPEGHLAEPSRGEWVWISAAYLEGVTLQRVERVYDLQAWMLLRLHNPDGARIWAWVERSRDARRWGDLRRALVAHA
ncbi:hypothetical protein [Hydrogenophaga sp. RWCD_12]|uniref:hypothetical protein n=1 Tax=Hydrogenophaga sp. RWCD_12 TaxID=3391190 RepID=UPI003984C4CB